MAEFQRGPSGPIQVIPPGLLSMLQLKSPAGQNPQVLNLDLQPTIELLDWYLLANCENLQALPGVTHVTADGPGFKLFTTNPIVVPNSEWWYVHYYTIGTTQLAAGDSMGVLKPMCQFMPGGAANFVTLGTDTCPATPALGAASVGASDFWLGPGTTVGFFLGGIVSAAGITFGGNMTFTRLRI